MKSISKYFILCYNRKRNGDNMKKRKKKRIKYKNVMITLLICFMIIFGLYKTIHSFFIQDDFIQTVNGPVKGIVVLDAGHGGEDVGCINGNIYEKDINLKYTKEIGNELMKNGIQVYYTRKSDQRIKDSQKDDLQARCDFAYEKKADYFISIHVNASESNVQGFEAYYYHENERSYNLASHILNCMEKLKYSKNRGLYEGNSLYVIKNNKVNSILIELGYIRSQDIDYLTNDTKIKKLSKKIAEGILETYKEIEEK